MNLQQRRLYARLRSVATLDRLDVAVTEWLEHHESWDAIDAFAIGLRLMEVGRSLCVDMPEAPGRDPAELRELRHKLARLDRTLERPSLV